MRPFFRIESTGLVWPSGVPMTCLTLGCAVLPAVPVFRSRLPVIVAFPALEQAFFVKGPPLPQPAFLMNDWFVQIHKPIEGKMAYIEKESPHCRQNPQCNLHKVLGAYVL